MSTGIQISSDVGVTLSGLTSVTVTRSIDSIPWQFDASFVPSAMPVPPKPGQVFQVSYNDKNLITGYINRVELSQTADAEDGALAGRSIVADLVDSGWIDDANIYYNIDLDYAIKSLCDAFAISFDCEYSLSDLGDPIEFFTIETGEPVYDAMLKLAGMRGFLLIDTPDGHIRLTRAGQDLAETRLVSPGNIATHSITVDDSDRYYQIRSHGTAPASEERKPKQTIEYLGDAYDSAIRPHRFLSQQIDYPVYSVGDCDMSSAWQAAIRMGRSTTVSIGMPGWTQDNGELWAPNMQVQVTDPFLGVDATLLIVGTRQSYDSRGYWTDLTLAPVAGYWPVAPDDAQATLGSPPLDGIELWKKDE